jgi:hypothetical protein
MSEHELVVCSKCRSIKPVNAFVVDRSKKSGHTSQCKTCRYPQSREWKTQNCERQNLAQRRYRKRTSSNHREGEQCSRGNVSWWEVFDNQRASRELEELGDGFQLVSKKETHISLLMKADVYSLKEWEGIIDGLIADGEVTQNDPLELFLVCVVLKLNSLGVWVNFLILTN